MADTDYGRTALESIEAEYNKHADRNSWHKYYQEIRDKCDLEAKEKKFTTFESKRSENSCLNRYANVNPYDHSRIVLRRGTVDYINANLVKLERADRKYILTQGPLTETIGHFWLMVWEQNSRAILMLNKLIEKNQVKGHLYWPEHKGSQHALNLNDVQLKVEYVRHEQYKNFIRRWFKLTDLETQTSREIMQFHYITWPDFGIPSSPNAFLQFLKQVRDSGALNSDVGPAIVHCSAGIGRSGTFCLVDCCLVLVEMYDQCDVSKVLCELRTYRMGLIQTTDQLYFSYQAIIEGIKLSKDPSFLDYTEEPIIKNDEESQTQEQYNSDESPPPLPPRTHSLSLIPPNAGSVLTSQTAGYCKQLPSNICEDDDNFKPIVADPNRKLDELEVQLQNESLLSNRPLPPLPTNVHNSLDHVHESNSESDDASADSDTSTDDVREYKDENSHAGNNRSDDVNANSEKSTAEHSKSLSPKVNGIEKPNMSSSSPENEVKRRKRVDYQASLEQKVIEIKRKQRESDEGKQTAKKRRSLLTYIAAGVVVGVIAVYAYSKLG